MFDILSHTVNIITDSTQRWTKKFAIVILITFSFWFLNDAFDFVHSFRINNRLQQLENISQLLKDTTLTDEQCEILRGERDKIISRTTTLDKIYALIDARWNSFGKPFNDSIKEDSKNSQGKNFWLNFISGNVLLIFVILVLPTQFPKSDFWTNAIASIVVFVLGFFICWLISLIFDLIPVIWNRTWINYLLNVVIQFVVWMIFGLIISLTSAKKNSRYKGNKSTGGL